MKKLSCVIAAAIMFLAASASADPLMDAIKKEAIEVNKSLPEKIDEITTWTEMSVGPGRRVILHYIVSDVVGIDNDAIKTLLTAELKKTVCGKDETKVYHSLGIVVEFLYRDSDGNLICSIALDTKECGK